MDPAAVVSWGCQGVGLPMPILRVGDLPTAWEVTWMVFAAVKSQTMAIPVLGLNNRNFKPAFGKPLCRFSVCEKTGFRH